MLTSAFFTSCILAKTSVDRTVDTKTENTITTKEKWWGTGSGYAGDGPRRRNTTFITTNSRGTTIFYEYKKIKISGCIGSTIYHETKKYNDLGKLIESIEYKSNYKIVNKFDSLGKFVSKTQEKIEVE